MTVIRGEARTPIHAVVLPTAGGDEKRTWALTAPRPAVAGALVDDRFGLIRRLVRLGSPERLPRSYISYGAELAHGPSGSGRPEPFLYGAALGNEAQAQAAAIGRAVEHYCGGALPLEGDVPHHGNESSGHVSDGHHASGALAAGRSPARARRRALEKLVARMVMTTWRQGHTNARRIDISSHTSLTGLLADPDGATELGTSLWWIPSTCRAPIVGALVEDRRDGLVACGSACCETAEAAATKATTRALEALIRQRHIIDAVSDRPLAHDQPHPCGPEDINACCRLGGDASSQGRCLADLTDDGDGIDIRELTDVGAEDSSAAHVADLARVAPGAETVELTTPDVRALGLAVVGVTTNDTDDVPAAGVPAPEFGESTPGAPTTRWTDRYRGRLDATGAPDATLVDARTGLVRRIERRPIHPHLPQVFRLVAAHLADTTRFSPWPADPSSAGCVAWDWDAAEGAAIGEAMERYCGNLVPPLDDLRHASYDQLRAAGDDAVDPMALARFTPEQYAAPGFPFVPFTRHLPVRWVEGRRLLSGEPAWIPASYAWVTYLRAEPTHAEPRTNLTAYGGIAAGRSLAEAEWSALRELVERDAVTFAWTGGGTIAPLVVPDWLADLARGPRDLLSVRFMRFPAATGLPVIGALMNDREDGYMSLGLACRADPVDSALKALAEAVADQMVVRQLDDPESPMSRIAATDASPLKPWRADRSYGSLYRSDWRDAPDTACHLQVYLDTTVQARFVSELDAAMSAPEPFPGRTAEAGVDAASALARTARRLRADGVELFAVDLTTEEVRSTGLRVARVVATGLLGNVPAAFPQLGSRRLVGQLGASRAIRLLPLPH